MMEESDGVMMENSDGVMINIGVSVRNSPGVQEWTDGSRYEGEFLNGLKHGHGTFTWPNGERYEGSFFKDYCHGRATYMWPDGSRFTGKCYLNRKEGYGVHLFPDGTVFKGLYHSDVRFGPGVMSYPDGHQDVGLWYRQWLLRLCTTLKGGFSIMDFPEHTANLTQSLPSFTSGSFMASQHFCTDDTYLLDDSSPLEDDQFILPPGIENYSTDSDHLPIPRRLRQELDLHFFNRVNITRPSFSDRQPLQTRMEAHIHTYRFEVEETDWDVAAVLAMNRDDFGPKGPLELRSESLIREASLGDLQKVRSILIEGKVHLDVGDARGYTALIAATAGCYDDMIHLLLDSGADVNKMNVEGMSALAVCGVLYYPIQTLQETVAERISQDVTTKLQISEPKTTVNSPLGAASEDRSKAAVDTELLATDRKLEKCSTQQKPEPYKHTEEIKITSKIEEVSQSMNNERGRPLEAKLSKKQEPPDGRIPKDTSASCQENVDGENVFFAEKEQKTYRNISPGQDTDFDVANFVAGFHINTTEDITQQMAEVLCPTGQEPAGTQETVHRDEAHWATMKLLLERGADPNVSRIPMPVIFMAIKAGHIEAVQRMLECGARTDIHLSAEQKGLYPLHVSAGLSGPEGPKITQMLLHAAADPDVKAQDACEVFELDKISETEQGDSGNTAVTGSQLPTSLIESSVAAPKEGGRTPLHVACQRNTELENARDVVSILLSHKASTDHLWSGHSPLSLAIATGNDLAVDELLAAGADPNLPLFSRVSNALCAAASILYNPGPQLHNRIKLIEKLMKAGANMLMPVVVGEKNKSAIGTAVDYAYYVFNKDCRVSRIPYHALKPREREEYCARCQLITMMAELMRQSATSLERQRLENEKNQGIQSVSPTEKFVFIGNGATLSTDRTKKHKAIEEQKEAVNESRAQMSSQSKDEAKTWIVRKPLFKYCYQCSRSAWVALLPCSRCHEVFYCSEACKLKAWTERHKEECIRVPGWTGSGHLDLKSKVDKPDLSKTVADTLTHQHHPDENYSFI